MRDIPGSNQAFYNTISWYILQAKLTKVCVTHKLASALLLTVICNIILQDGNPQSFVKRMYCKGITRELLVGVGSFWKITNFITILVKITNSAKLMVKKYICGVT